MSGTNPNALQKRSIFQSALTEHQRGQLAEAERLYRDVLKLDADDFDATHLLGVIFVQRGQFVEGERLIAAALKIDPSEPSALNNRGIALYELKRFEEAIASFDKAIGHKPDYAEAFGGRANALKGLKRYDEAIASYDKAISLKQDYAEAFSNRGNALHELNRFDEAIASYNKALEIKPNDGYALGGAADCVLRVCDWTQRAIRADELKRNVAEGKSIIYPFVFLWYGSDAVLQLKCAQSYITGQIPIAPRPLWDGRIWRNDRIRVAYLSADFCHHPTAFLTAELFELHDRSRFEVLGISFGTDDKSSMRSRLINACDRFHDVQFKDDRYVAELLHALQVDVAIDLKGHTREAREGILGYRPAPIQVNYLGYPGTMGADFIDYVIADKIVLPFDQQPYYTEKIVHLPECYQVNDSQRRIGSRTPSRQETGLPEDGFVFCCFNNNYKIIAPIFDVWMRLLRTVNGSVLWLLRDNESAEKNIRREAARRAIDPERLIFADRIPLEQHLARHRVADLFLDTLPCNAHTTASDALWTGLPVLTSRGNSFAGRVAASLLNAVGLPELVTHNLDDYEALALRLAKDRSLLAGIRAKLVRNRETCALFDSKRSTRHLEAAYVTMWNIWQRGERPQSFSVAPEQSSKTGFARNDPSIFAP
jgi:protein O-GlcNAc transferase